MDTAKPASPKKKRTALETVGRVIAWIVASVLLLIVLVLILIQVPSVQNFARKKIVSYLENKLHTKVAIGNLDVDFPTSLSLKKVYLEDQAKDTLLYGGEIKVDISMLRLLRSDIEIQEIALNNVILKVKRVPPDTVFNFQFIADAFTTQQTKETTTPDSSTMQMNIDRILVNDTRIVYYDPYTGNDMDLTFGHLDTKIYTFDPTHLLFDIPSIKLNGLTGYFHQIKPLKKTVGKSVDEAAAQPQNYLQFHNKEIRVSNVNVEFNSEPSQLESSYIIGDLTINTKTIDLKKSVMTFDGAQLSNSTIKIQINSNQPNQAPPDSVLATSSTPPFKIISSSLEIDNSNFKFDDKGTPAVASGMDYSHMYLKDISLKAQGLEYSLDTTIVSIQSATLKEQSGFVLDNLSTDFKMTPTGISLEDMLFETPGSEIKRSAIITYPSLAALQKDPGVLGLNIDLVDSKIAMKDVFLTVPALSAQTMNIPATATLYVDARITGRVNDLNLHDVVVRGLTATDINVNGVIRGLPDPNNFYADLDIRKFQSSRRDIVSLVPPNTLPPNITVPEAFSASGKIKGGMENLYTNLTVNSTLGGAKVEGTLQNITDQNNARYELTLNARSLNLGKLMQNPQLGLVTGDISAKGVGFNPQTANATFNGVVANITLNGYNYKNINLDGSIANKSYRVKASVHDPNLYADLSSRGEFIGQFPSVHVTASIDSIKTLPLNFSTVPVKYHGDIEADFTNVDPNNLAGNLTVTHSIIVYNGERTTLDTLQLFANSSGGNQSLILKSDFASATIIGQYKLTQLADVFQKAVNPYYSIAGKMDTVTVAPYDFTITAGINDNPAIKAFVPSLEELKPVNLTAHFASDSGWNAFVKAPYIKYGSIVIDSLALRAHTANEVLAFTTSFNRLISGSSLAMFATTLSGTLQNNNLNFTLNVKDAKSKDKYLLSGSLDQPSLNDYVLSLSSDTLLLNYDKWNVASNNAIKFINNDITANNFTLSQGSKQLSINSVGNGANKPLRIDFNNFNVATITGLIQNDSLLVGGLLNGNAVVKNIQSQPNFTTDLTIQHLSIYQDTIGNLSAKVNNNVANTYNADISLTGQGNKININGNYYLKPQNQSSYDFTVDIVSFQLKSIEGLTHGAIKNARGNLYGKIALNGSIPQPNIDGQIHFNNTAVNVAMLNNIFKVDKEAIAIVNNEGIQLNTFTIRDTANNPIVIDGMLKTKNFYDYVFDLKVNADHFQAINSTKKDNDLFYGDMVFSTQLTIKGTPNQPVVDGSVTINGATDFTIVLPQAEPGVVKREGVVRFVDYSAIPEDSLFMAPYDSLNTAPLVGFDVSINLNISKEATFNVIVDAGNGDYLKLKGTGELTAGIDPSGKITMVGSYEIEEGAYNLSFNFIKRDFTIQKGSRIVWTGEPTTAQLDVTAIYVAETAPLDLVQGQVEGNPIVYRQKLPFNVNLNINGELMQPKITFNIVLPENKNYGVSTAVVNTVRTKLTQLRQEPGELNKQVFALLLLNRFVSENPFASSSGGSLDAGTFARQSVSRLLTEQLNQLTEGLVQGVDINFDVATTEDYTSGQKQNRTNFNVALTKRLLNDRLSVTVGRDFELEGPTQTNTQQNNLAGNIAITYQLSKDGQYLLRAYRQSDYTGAIEGYVIETGLSFIISVDFNKLKEIFTSKEERRKKRQIKRENKQEMKQQEDQDSEQQASAVSFVKE